jgi:hypothetical protein
MGKMKSRVNQENIAYNLKYFYETPCTPESAKKSIIKGCIFLLIPLMYLFGGLFIFKHLTHLGSTVFTVLFTGYLVIFLGTALFVLFYHREIQKKNEPLLYLKDKEKERGYRWAHNIIFAEEKDIFKKYSQSHKLADLAIYVIEPETYQIIDVIDRLSFEKE